MLREQCEPLQLATLRYSFGGVLLLVAGAAHRPARHQSSLTVNAILAATMFAAPNLLLLWAAQHGAGSLTPLIYAAMPLGLSLAVGKLRPAAIAAVGAMLVLLNGSFTLTAEKLIWALPTAVAVALQGWSLVYARRHLATASSLIGVGMQLLAAAAMLWIALQLQPERATPPLAHWPASSIAALAALAVLGTAAASPLDYQLLAHLEPAQVAVSEWLQILVAVGESAVLLGQQPGWTMIVAAFILVVCAIQLLRSDHLEASVRLGLSA
jgi:drug/metabolite transporter (DMT)-like permease